MNFRKESELIYFFESTQKFKYQIPCNNFFDMIKFLCDKNPRKALEIYASMTQGEKVDEIRYAGFENRFISDWNSLNLNEKIFPSLNSKALLETCLNINKSVQGFEIKKCLLFQELYNLDLKEKAGKIEYLMMEKESLETQRDGIYSEIIKKRKPFIQTIEQEKLKIDDRNSRIVNFNRIIRNKIKENEEARSKIEDLKQKILETTDEEVKLNLNQHQLRCEILVNGSLYDTKKAEGEIALTKQMIENSKKLIEINQKKIDKIENERSADITKMDEEIVDIERKIADQERDVEEYKREWLALK